MRCPFCSHLVTKVKDSRENGEGDQVRRRRECVACGARFTSYETVELNLPRIIKSDNRREAFDEDTIRGIVYKDQKLDMYLSFQGGGGGWYAPIKKYKEFHHGQDEWNDPHCIDDNINSLLVREQDWEGT